MRAHGPDGRVWEVARRPEAQRAFAALMPRANWLVEARTEGETRVWRAKSRGEATKLVTAVALALRTGGPSPAGELDAGELDTAEPSPERADES